MALLDRRGTTRWSVVHPMERPRLPVVMAVVSRARRNSTVPATWAGEWPKSLTSFSVEGRQAPEAQGSSPSPHERGLCLEAAVLNGPGDGDGPREASDGSRLTDRTNARSDIRSGTAPMSDAERYHAQARH